MHQSTPADFEQMVLLMGACMLGGLLLFAYQLYCLFDLMAKNSPVTESNERLIWALLIFLVPMAVGAWLYQLKVHQRVFPVFFVVAFLLTAMSMTLFVVRGVLSV